MRLLGGDGKPFQAVIEDLPPGTFDCRNYIVVQPREFWPAIFTPRSVSIVGQFAPECRTTCICVVLQNEFPVGLGNLPLLSSLRRPSRQGQQL